jgi:MFS family permease
MVFSPVAGAYVADQSPEHLRGRYSGAWGLAWGVALVLAPSLGARIIFVADAFDAMTSNRLYRKPISRDSALREVQRCAGSQFDPEIVQAFFAAIGVAPAAVA